ncbi:MAG: sigma 54-interacting transcriptional regulator [Chitinophagales bacterium]
MTYETEVFQLIFSEGLIINFLNSIEKGIIILDNEQDILFINKKAQNKLGKTLKEIRGAINQFISPDNIHKVLTDGINYSLKRMQKEENVYIDVCAIELNHNIIGVVMVLNETDDITDYVNTIKISRSISRELETIYNSTCDEILVTDSQGVVVKVSAFYENLYDLASSKYADFIGKNVSDLERGGVFTPSVCLRVLKEKKRVSTTQVTNSGKVLVVTGYPIFDENENLASVISMAKDITEVHLLKSKLEEAKKTNQKYYYQLEAFKQAEGSQEKFAYKSKEIEKIMITATNIAMVDSNVLITGESGVGKSLFAEYIHDMSRRNRELFVSINCGAIPETLLESELFGYEKGAFTGANKTGKIGKIDLANKGTLFLDEISEMPFPLQVKILKVIQEKKYTRVGGTETISSDFRLIAASNKNLVELVRGGKFREDLFYRLNVIPIEIPPLRERKEDIVYLANTFWEKLNEKYGTHRKLDKEVYDVLTDYPWPGNVRELENCIERIMVTVNKDYVRVEDLPLFLMNNNLSQEEYRKIVPLKKALEDTEKSLILKAYDQYKNTYKVAELLGVSQSTIVRRLKKYGYHIATLE